MSASMDEQISEMRDALREAHGILAELVNPDMSRSASSIYYRAVASEVKARRALERATKGTDA